MGVGGPPTDKVEGGGLHTLDDLGRKVRTGGRCGKPNSESQQRQRPAGRGPSPRESLRHGLNPPPAMTTGKPPHCTIVAAGSSSSKSPAESITNQSGRRKARPKQASSKEPVAGCQNYGVASGSTTGITPRSGHAK